MKKRKGSIPIGELLILLIGLAALAVVFSTCLKVIRCVSIRDKADQIARCYILEMETVGYLSATSGNSLTQELLALDVTDVDLTGTTMTDVGYGQRIYLQISYQIPMENLNTSSGNLMSFFFEDKKMLMNIKKMSTAKR